MFDKIGIIHAPTTYQQNDKAVREVGEKLSKRVDDLIKAKDRVDISIDEYHSLKNRTVQYERQARRTHEIIVRMGIPIEVIESIIDDSVKVCFANDVREFKRHYRIEFDVDDSPSRKFTPEY